MTKGSTEQQHGSENRRPNYAVAAGCPRHSHSIFPGGFDVMSQVTRLILRTSLMILLATRPQKAC